MSKCWYCNEELTTGNNPEHIGICEKCYNEMFKYGNEFIRNMAKQQMKKVEEKCKVLEKALELLAQDYISFTDEVEITGITEYFIKQAREELENARKNL